MQKLCVSLIASHLLLLGAVATAPNDALAQRAGDRGESEEPETRETPTMRQAVYERLSEAQACAEMGDMECAREQLERIERLDNLNSYERAQMWYFYAFIYFNAENYPEAINAYQNVIEQPDLPLSLERDARRALAQLYVQQERYREGLQMLETWFDIAENPAPSMYALKAQIYYQLQEYEQGIEPIQTAIAVAREQGREIEEGWYQLLNVFYFELENYPKVIETLSILVENWPKKDYMVQLAGIYGQEGEEDKMLALYEAAYEASWLTRSTELVSLAQMFLQAEVPYKAAQLLEQGLEEGTIEETQDNWRLLSQAWQLAREDQKALPALRQAAQLADDGELNINLAQSHANLAQWQECVDAAETGLERGGLDRPDQANLLLGNCLAELERYQAARTAFEAAAEDDRSRDAARQWIDYVEGEQERLRQLERARQTA